MDTRPSLCQRPGDAARRAPRAGARRDGRPPSGDGRLPRAAAATAAATGQAADSGCRRQRSAGSRQAQPRHRWWSEDERPSSGCGRRYRGLPQRRPPPRVRQRTAGCRRQPSAGSRQAQPRHGWWSEAELPSSGGSRRCRRQLAQRAMAAARGGTKGDGRQPTARSRRRRTRRDGWTPSPNRQPRRRPRGRRPGSRCALTGRP